MYVRALLCALLAAVPAPLSADGALQTSTELTIPSPFRGSFATVPKIDCLEARGSGVRVSDDIVITARHVIQNSRTGKWRSCIIDSRMATLATLGEGGLDFAAVRVPLGRGLRAIVSCEGIKPGERYYAYGYALGMDANVEPLIGTDDVLSDGRTYLRGRVYPGMSGGALSNSEGAVVGITVAYNPETDQAVVVPLTRTYLCRRS